MSITEITYCPGTLASGNATYSISCLRRMFNGRRVKHILPYASPANDAETQIRFIQNQQRISISGVQEKFSVLLEKNKLRLVEEGEQGTYILKPIPSLGKNADQIPANEHLTMQIARQVFGIETAENVLIFFKDGEPAYLTKRFDVNKDGTKLAKEDFASLAGRTPYTHGTHYKYLGNYLELFAWMKQYIPAYRLEAPKLFRLLVFNYLFSNGDAHLKNFSVLETTQGDFRLSPAYDLLNTRIHIEDTDFALEDGLLPKHLAKGKILIQYQILAKEVGLTDKQMTSILDKFLSNPPQIKDLIKASFLSEKAKRTYLQAYQTRVKKMKR